MQNIAKGLIKFQHECPAIEKDSEVEVLTKSGGKYRFKYASFGNIVQTIKQPMFDSRLGYTFITDNEKFTCRIVHESGESLDTSIPMPRFKESMQENGSLLTYCKRYTLVLALGLDVDADDDSNLADGNEATVKQKELKNHAPQTQREASQPTNERTVSEAQIKRLSALKFKSTLSWEDISAYVRDNFGKSDSKTLVKSEYDKLCAYIEENTVKG